MALEVPRVGLTVGKVGELFKSTSSHFTLHGRLVLSYCEATPWAAKNHRLEKYEKLNAELPLAFI